MDTLKPGIISNRDTGKLRSCTSIKTHMFKAFGRTLLVTLCLEMANGTSNTQKNTYKWLKLPTKWWLHHNVDLVNIVRS